MNFDALFEQIYPSLRRYLHRLTGDADQADDAAQEAFARLARAPIPEGGEKGWLFTVATNLVRDHARTTARRQRILSAVPLETAAPERPDEAADRADAVRSVRNALQLLTPRERQMLLMREEGFSYREIAAAVDVAPASVGALTARALKRFAAAYKQQQGEEEP